MSFIHQDASGASIQQTNSSGTLTQTGTRAGEYDALGRNVADASPFISLNSEPPPSESGSSGIDLDGTSAGYRAGRQIYRIDGQVVSQASFMETVNSGQIGGAFGLLEMTARMSTQEIRWERTWTWGGDASSGDVIKTNTNTLTLTMGVYQVQNWSVMLAIYSQTQNTYAGLPARKLVKGETDLLRKNIEKYLSNDCKAFISKLIEQVAKDVGSTPISTSVLELFDKVASNRGGPDSGGHRGGIWGYLVPSGGSTAGTDRVNNIYSLGLAISNYARDGMTSAAFNKLDGEEQFFRTYESFQKFASTTNDAFTVIHELIHTSVLGGGAGDISLARAALSFTGQKLNLEGLSTDAGVKAASNIWTNRLMEACGVKGKFPQDKLNKYIR